MKRLCGNCEKVYDDAHAPVKYYHVPGAAVDPVPVRLCPYCGCPEHSGIPNNQWEKRFHKVDYVKIKEGELRVSTVNLMVAHDERLFWETMVFDVQDEEGLRLESYPQWRYETKEEAVKNHERIVELLRKGKYRLVPATFHLEIVEE